MSPGLKASAILRRVEELLNRARSTPTPAQRTSQELSRRNFLQLSALAGAAASLDEGRPVRTPRPEIAHTGDPTEATVADLQAAMTAGQLNAISLVNFYQTRIATLDQKGPKVNSIIEVNPDAQAIALQLDAERRAGRVRGPLHGIPIVLKDNVDTGDSMQTAAGSLGLVGTPPTRDSTVAAKLRAAGAVILGKTTLSEWANFRGFSSSSGWSGRGGPCHNPYALHPNPRGSSSGCRARRDRQQDGGPARPGDRHEPARQIRPSTPDAAGRLHAVRQPGRAEGSAHRRRA